MKVDFTKMSKSELKDYILNHREDQEAFYAYMDKLQTSPVITTHSPSDTKSLEDVIERVRQTNRQQKDL